MRKIYAVGCMQFDPANEHKPIKSTYLHGLYTTFENAEQAVLTNEGDMIEYYYNMLIIEEMYMVGEGNDEYHLRKTHWYKVEFIAPTEGVFGKEPVVFKTEQPEMFKSVCHFLGGF